MRVIGVIDALVVRELADDSQLAREWLATRLVARRRTTAAALEATGAAAADLAAARVTRVATTSTALQAPDERMLALPAKPTAAELVITGRLRKVLVLAWETQIARLVRRDPVEPAEGDGG